MPPFTGTMSRASSSRTDRRLKDYPPEVREKLILLLDKISLLPKKQQDWEGWKAFREIWPEDDSWSQANLWIATKRKGELTRLRFNRVQQKLNRVIQAQESKGVPVRVIILKARQMGVSTFIQGRHFTKCALGEGTFALTVANKKSASKGLMRMNKRFLNNLFFAPGMTEASTFGLQFAHDSSMAVETARSADEMGRSHTIHLLHCSELAFWLQPEAGLNALFQTMGEYPGCACMIESTANGKNYFHKMWQDASSGKSDFVPVFFPWYEDPTYVRALPGDMKRQFEDTLSDEEANLIKKFKLSLEQLAWRRHTIRNKCGNSLPKFMQEYPATPKEAFQFSSSPVFDQNRIDDLKECVVKPKRGNLVFRLG